MTPFDVLHELELFPVIRERLSSLSPDEEADETQEEEEEGDATEEGSEARHLTTSLCPGGRMNPYSEEDEDADEEEMEDEADTMDASGQ